MTSNVELLPLYDELQGHPKIEIIKHYARACVEASTKYYRDMLCQSQDDVMKLSAETEALRAEVEKLQDIVRPRREDACLTIDHWRMRAYDLEANWGRACRAANSEATARKVAEARAERLAEALREIEVLSPLVGVSAARTIARAALHPTEA